MDEEDEVNNDEEEADCETNREPKTSTPNRSQRNKDAANISFTTKNVEDLSTSFWQNRVADLEKKLVSETKAHGETKNELLQYKAASIGMNVFLLFPAYSLHLFLLFCLYCKTSRINDVCTLFIDNLSNKLNLKRGVQLDKEGEAELLGLTLAEVEECVGKTHNVTGRNLFSKVFPDFKSHPVKFDIWQHKDDEDLANTDGQLRSDHGPTSRPAAIVDDSRHRHLSSV
ncbi:unnamed protein product [Didymodactylos carnosus]|uniref:Uncharacterized protein n=1 Tax=Didymodactylos carnosus TaxID=1234261 RepID=A0A8S2DPF4_9BILA|nr:unnamed protein product [Didymodactylos carnosus]CAF3720927.1 unnamed protein product [Didymodactylos carnosus]